MDLKIKDVADLLSVSETTIRRWLADGKIPAYKLNHQYRFSRIEIENWMLKCKLDLEKPYSSFSEDQIYPSKSQHERVSNRGGTQQFSLFRALNKGDLLVDVEGKDKEEIIKNTLNKVAPSLGVDADVVAELFLDRERLMPTSLSNGVAVPHSRDFILKGPASDMVVFLKQPIEYGALDGKPVHTMFFLFSSDDKRHLHLLAKIAHLSSCENTLKALSTHSVKDSLLEFIKDWEGQLRNAF